MKIKTLLLFVALGSSSYVSANCYIGDSIAHGYRINSKGTGITKVGANPKLVYSFIQRQPCTDKTIYLSSGISNNPSDFNTVEKQLQSLKNHNVKLLGTSVSFPKHGNNLNIKLSSICSKYSNCTFIGGFTPSKDRVHPRSYKL